MACRLVAFSTQHVLSSCNNASYNFNTFSRSINESLVFKLGQVEEGDKEEEDATGAGIDLDSAGADVLGSRSLFSFSSIDFHDTFVLSYYTNSISLTYLAITFLLSIFAFTNCIPSSLAQV